MNSQAGYGQFCPVAMAAEVLCTRWTIVVLRELLCGSRRFNELRRGVPRMSPALLSKRLKELEELGVIERSAERRSGIEYRLTRAGRDLWPVVEGMGIWGQRWLETQATLKNLDPSLLMWDMRRRLDPAPMPERRVVIQFIYPELAEPRRRFWLIVEPGKEVDLCAVDPGFDVDLYVVADLRTLTAIWMGLTSVADAIGSKKLELTGDAALARSMQRWLGLSPFAKERKLAAA